MAEFLSGRQKRHQPMDLLDPDAGFNAYGKTVPTFRKTAGYQHAKEMGLDAERATFVVDAMCEQIARDEPYKAMEAGMVYLDLTGTYRMLAVLLATPDPKAHERKLDIE